MIDETFFKILSVFLKLSNLTGGTPFSWDLNEKKVKITKSALRRLRFQCLLIIGYLIWEFYVMLKLRNSPDLKIFYMTFGLIFAGILDSVTLLIVCFKREHFAQVLTCTLRLTLDIQSET